MNHYMQPSKKITTFDYWYAFTFWYLKLSFDHFSILLSTFHYAFTYIVRYICCLCIFTAPTWDPLLSVLCVKSSRPFDMWCQWSLRTWTQLPRPPQEVHVLVLGERLEVLELTEKKCVFTSLSAAVLKTARRKSLLQEYIHYFSYLQCFCSMINISVLQRQIKQWKRGFEIQAWNSITNMWVVEKKKCRS